MPTYQARLYFLYFAGMDEVVEIPVTINGQDRVFPARIQSWRYGMRFFVDIDGVEMILERDEGGEFRAILPDQFIGKPPSKEIVAAIVEVLQSL